MNKTVFINQQPVKLDPAQLIQSGGEGMVFRYNSTAVKLYHHPTPQHQTKLTYWFQSRLGQHVPTAVLSPNAPVTDAHGSIIGFQMPLLPQGSQPLKLLSNPLVRQKNNMPLPTLVALLQQIHTVLTHLHQSHILIGDLNDTNLFFTLSSPHLITPSFIDADSYQFGNFPCPVAMPAFLDPDLYEVSNFGARPYFSPRTDWYAFTVLLVKTLLGVHPYGGVHPQFKTVMARAQAHISILHPSVTPPHNSLPLDTLSDELQHYMHRLFEVGERPSFPATLFAHMLRPTARQKPVTPPVATTTTGSWRTLLTDEGMIEHLALLPNGRILVILHTGQSYKLVRLGMGGKWEEMPLFEGKAGYQFAHFCGNFLAVNPPQRPHLLLLDIGGSSPQKLSMIETAVFRDTAVFAATPQHLYRIAGNWIMRGQVQNGQYVEDAIATAHKNQTYFQASPYNDAIAGYHRIFAEYRFFVQTNQGSYDLLLPPLPPGTHIAATGLAFGLDTVAVILKVMRHGRHPRTNTHVYSFTGQHQHSHEEAEDVWDTAVATYPITPLPADYTSPTRLLRLGHHLLRQEPTRLLVSPP